MIAISGVVAFHEDTACVKSSFHLQYGHRAHKQQIIPIYYGHKKDRNK